MAGCQQWGVVVGFSPSGGLFTLHTSSISQSVSQSVNRPIGRVCNMHDTTCLVGVALVHEVLLPLCRVAHLLWHDGSRAAIVCCVCACK